MKCPKCGYTSFDDLQNCRKCGVDLAEHKARFNLRSLFFPGDTNSSGHRPPLDDDIESSLGERSELVPEETETAPANLARDDFEAEFDWSEAGRQEIAGAVGFPGKALTVGAAASARAAGMAAEEIAAEEEPVRLSLEDFDRAESVSPTFFGIAPQPRLVPAGPFGDAASQPDPPAWGLDPDIPRFGATASARLGAAMADFLILAAVFGLFLFAGELALHPVSVAARPLSVALLDQSTPYFLVLFFLGFGYFTLFHFLLGQTVGKMLLHLRVETLAGVPISFSHAFLRSAGGLLSLLALGFGYLPILRGEGRGWNDRLAGTRVVRGGGPPGVPEEPEISRPAD